MKCLIAVFVAMLWCSCDLASAAVPAAAAAAGTGTAAGAGGTAASAGAISASAKSSTLGSALAGLANSRSNKKEEDKDWRRQWDDMMKLNTDGKKLMTMWAPSRRSLESLVEMLGSLKKLADEAKPAERRREPSPTMSIDSTLAQLKGMQEFLDGQYRRAENLDRTSQRMPDGSRPSSVLRTRNRGANRRENSTAFDQESNQQERPSDILRGRS